MYIFLNERKLLLSIKSYGTKVDDVSNVYSCEIASILDPIYHNYNFLSPKSAKVCNYSSFLSSNFVFCEF